MLASIVNAAVDFTSMVQCMRRIFLTSLSTGDDFNMCKWMNGMNCECPYCEGSVCDNLGDCEYIEEE